ncbi:peptide-methionine (S)-S-oxide reductase [Rhizobium laguerreae]|uniref:peptide-methionine (S)-S-oxide reductase n=1 Tax=Rhizobium laguerreae TaxID=1076926 RepID=UPI0031BA72C9
MFFRPARPDQLNRQGPDTGRNYRSAIFPANDEQPKVAKAYIGRLNHVAVFGAAIVTKIETGKTVYAADNYHQDFLTNNRLIPIL